MRKLLIILSAISLLLLCSCNKTQNNKTDSSHMEAGLESGIEQNETNNIDTLYNDTNALQEIYGNEDYIAAVEQIRTRKLSGEIGKKVIEKKDIINGSPFRIPKINTSTKKLVDRGNYIFPVGYNKNKLLGFVIMRNVNGKRTFTPTVSMLDEVSRVLNDNEKIDDSPYHEYQEAAFFADTENNIYVVRRNYPDVITVYENPFGKRNEFSIDFRELERITEINQENVFGIHNLNIKTGD